MADKRKKKKNGIILIQAFPFSSSSFDYAFIFYTSYIPPSKCMHIDVYIYMERLDIYYI